MSPSLKFVWKPAALLHALLSNLFLSFAASFSGKPFLFLQYL